MEIKIHPWMGALGRSTTVCLTMMCLFASPTIAQNIDVQHSFERGNPKVASVFWSIGATSTASAKAVDSSDGRHIQPEDVVVFLVPDRGKTTETIDIDGVNRIGGEVLGRSKHYIRARVPADQIDLASQIDGVRFVQPPIRPQIQKVTGVGEGADLVNALANQMRGVKGQRVKVAVIDPGFFKGDIAYLLGELPDSLFYRDLTSTNNDAMFSGASVHGTACAEIVADVAPEVIMYLLRIGDLLDFEQAKELCVQEGIKIVSFSGSWLGTGFGDGLGVACEIVDDAAQNGILWVNAAGNYAARQYSALWSDKDSDRIHNIDGDLEVLYFKERITAGETIEVWLTWNDWPSSSQDYDLFLVKVSDAGGVEYAAQSLDVQSFSDPVEHVKFEVAVSGRYGIVITKSATARSEILKVWSSAHDFDRPAAIVGTIGTPADAVGAVAVGAVDYHNWARGTVEPYSSRGPTTDGRVKPDITAPTGVTTLAYGSNAFPGTSASAPYVAGAAALILSANPKFTRAELQEALMASTVDLGERGKDNTFGAGKIVLPTLQAPPMPAAPVASFSASIASGTVPLTVVFSDKSSGEPTTFSWDFGDGGTATEKSPTHTYRQPGSFTVQLVVSNAAGVSRSSMVITVIEPPPVAAFTPSSSSGNAPLTVVFTNASTGKVTAYAWDFGDGTTSSENAPTHTFTRPGSFVVRLTATNSGGTSQASWAITVRATPPVAAFTPSVVSGIMPLTVGFKNQSSGEPTSYRWDFGDGTTSTEVSPTHVFRRPGAFTVQLIAENKNGTSQATWTITVTAPPPVAAFSISVSSGGVPLTVRFTSQSTGAPTAFSWIFGDGGTSVVESPTYTYRRAGVYTAQLTVSNASGTSKASKSITVLAISAAPSHLQMTDTPIGGSSQGLFTVTNTSSANTNLAIAMAGDDSSHFSVSPSAALLRPGKSRSFTVLFTPRTSGPKTAYVSISTDAGGLPLKVDLKAVAIAPPAEAVLSVAPVEITFASTRVDSTISNTLVVTNKTTGSKTITTSLSGPNASDFLVLPRTATIAGGKSRTFTLRFTPKATGPRSASLLIGYSGGGAPLPVSLRGQGASQGKSAAADGVTRSVSGALTANSRTFDNGWFYNEHPVRLKNGQQLVLRMQTPGEFLFAGVWDVQSQIYLGSGTHIASLAAEDTVTVPHDGNYTIDVTGRGGITGSYSFSVTATPGPLEIGLASKPIAISLGTYPGKLLGVDHDPFLGSFPNPFNSATTIRVQIGQPDDIRLRVFNLAGQEIRRLLEAKVEPGEHQILWDGCDNMGHTAASGVYFIHLEVGANVRRISRMLLMR